MKVWQHGNVLGCNEKKVSMLNKQKPCEGTIRPYNIVILKFLKSDMNLQFVTGVHAVFTYLTSHLWKPEHVMSELRRKASNETYGKGIKFKIYSIVKTFLIKCKVLHTKQSK